MIGKLANADAYISDTLDGTGHIKVNVSSSCVKVDYVKAYLPKDTLDGKHKNREIGFSYTVGNCLVTGIEEINKEMTNEDVKIFPNPSTNIIQVKFKDPISKFEIKLIDEIGNVVLKSNQTTFNVNNLPNGIYIVFIQTDKWQKSQKIITNK
jgi:hypothetical protein